MAEQGTAMTVMDSPMAETEGSMGAEYVLVYNSAKADAEPDRIERYRRESVDEAQS
jgi:hypothetical protein